MRLIDALFRRTEEPSEEKVEKRIDPEKREVIGILQQLIEADAAEARAWEKGHFSKYESDGTRIEIWLDPSLVGKPGKYAIEMPTTEASSDQGRVFYAVDETKVTLYLYKDSDSELAEEPEGKELTAPAIAQLAQLVAEASFKHPGTYLGNTDI